MSTPAESPPGGTDVLELRLFVAGDTARSGQAVTHLRALGEELLEGRYELEIIDIVAEPERAEEARILATPTVIRLSPPPRRRVTGDLSRRKDVLQALVPDHPVTLVTDVPDA